MIDVSDRMKSVLAGRAFRMLCRATITRGPDVIAADLPVTVGRETTDRSLKVPEYVTLQLPRVIDGVDWSADGVDSPIAPFGQRVHLKVGVEVGPDGVEWINRGEFLITEVDFTGPAMTINAAGLLFLPHEARLVAPFKPTGTIIAAVRRLIEPALTLSVHPDIVDRSAAGSNVIEEDRLEGVMGLIDTLPGDAYVTPAGYLRVVPAGMHDVGTDPDVTIARRHGTGDLVPAVSTVSTSSTRDGVFNVMVVRSTTNDGAPITGAVYDTSGSPASYGGPFNPLPVPDFYNHPAARTVPVAKAMARNLLARRAAPFLRAWRLECVPNPRIQIGDELTYWPTPTQQYQVVVDKLVMPYTAAAGPMVLSLKEVQS